MCYNEMVGFMPSNMYILHAISFFITFFLKGVLFMAIVKKCDRCGACLDFDTFNHENDLISHPTGDSIRKIEYVGYDTSGFPFINRSLDLCPKCWHDFRIFLHGAPNGKLQS